MGVKGRAHRFELKAQHGRARQLVAQQVHQQRGDQRAVHDQARVALDLGDILAIVVNAVAVEGQRRIAKQQHLVRHDAPRPDRLRRRGHGLRRHIVRRGCAAVDDVVVFGQRHGSLALTANFMAHPHKQQSASAPSFFFDIDDG